MFYFILGILLGWSLHGIVQAEREYRAHKELRNILLEKLQVEVEQTKEELERKS